MISKHAIIACCKNAESHFICRAFFPMRRTAWKTNNGVKKHIDLFCLHLNNDNKL